jgi:hypothetical protein
MFIDPLGSAVWPDLVTRLVWVGWNEDVYDGWSKWRRSSRRPSSRMLSHELENQVRNLIGPFVQRKMARVE